MTGPAERRLTPGEALEKLFMDNADDGRNAANDDLVPALVERARVIQALADLPEPPRRSKAPAGSPVERRSPGRSAAGARPVPPSRDERSRADER